MYRNTGPQRVGDLLAGLLAPPEATPEARTDGGLPRWVTVHPERATGRVLQENGKGAVLVELETYRYVSVVGCKPWPEREVREVWVPLRRLSPYRPAARVHA